MRLLVDDALLLLLLLLLLLFLGGGDADEDLDLRRKREREREGIEREREGGKVRREKEKTAARPPGGQRRRRVPLSFLSSFRFLFFRSLTMLTTRTKMKDSFGGLVSFSPSPVRISKRKEKRNGREKRKRKKMGGAAPGAPARTKTKTFLLPDEAKMMIIPLANPSSVSRAVTPAIAAVDVPRRAALRLAAAATAATVWSSRYVSVSKGGREIGKRRRR